MNLLNDCSEEEQDTAMDPNRKRSTSNLSALRNCTVQAMSNLLNANIDSGLMHSIGMYIVKHFICKGRVRESRLISLIIATKITFRQPN